MKEQNTAQENYLHKLLVHPGVTQDKCEDLAVELEIGYEGEFGQIRLFNSNEDLFFLIVDNNKVEDAIDLLTSC